MATLAGNTTASFNGAPIGEIYSLSFDWGGGASSARSKAVPFNASGGTVRFEAFGSVATSTWGQVGTLTIGGNGVSLTCTAVCTSVSLGAQVNDAVRTSLTFQIIQ